MGKILSAGGKDVLIKSVAQAIPVYSMSCFRLPQGLCKHINNIIRKFWWGCKQGKRKPAWVSWEVMTRPKYLGGLGFRDLELFNLALLSRQAWRLLQELTSLSARILKASYYPDGSILSAELGSRPSQIWRAILDGREILKQGIIKRIGNGQSTDIWTDNWLPKESSLRPFLCRVADPPSKVSELLIPATAQWNVNYICSVFLPVDADTILKIPVCTRNMEDFWAWHPDRKGVFSVSSAYKLLVTTKLQREAWLEGRGGASSNSREEDAWSNLWKLKVPSKVRIFLWRLARHSIPTTDVLQRRNMATQSACPLCGCQDSWRHALLSCTMSRCVWALSDENIVSKMMASTEPSAKNWLFVSYLQELNQAIDCEPRVQGQAVREQQRRWIPPPPGSHKINVDGALSRNRRVGVAAAICRDSNGNYLGASAVVYGGVRDPMILETYACREALALAEDLHEQNIKVASDCQGVVQDINEGTAGPNAAVIHEIIDRRASFSSCSFVFERRNNNFEAHNLAKFACNLDIGRHIWLGIQHDPIVIPINILDDQ